MYLFRKGWVGGQLGQTKKHMSQKKKKARVGREKMKNGRKYGNEVGAARPTKHYIKESMEK